jgi:hypothetical protein
MIRPLVFILVFFITVSSVQAQDPVDIASARASALIDSTMASLNLRAQRFNEELAKVNALKALEVSSLAKDIIPKNIEKIKDFLNYLDVYRSLSKKLMESTEDSVHILKEMMPSKMRESFLKEFMDAYRLDQNSFDKYTLALTKVFTQVNKVLTFAENSKIAIENNKLQFTDKKEYDEYSELIEEIEKSQKKLVNAGASSQRASIDAGKMMNEAYGKLKK